MINARFTIAILLLSSCATPSRHEASKAEIENAATRHLTKPEPWAAKAQLSVNARQDTYDGAWRVTANALEPRHTQCGCIPFIPSKSRELLFSRYGRFISSTPLP